MGCRALPCRVIAPDRAYSTSSNRLALVRLRRPSRGAMGKRSPQHRRSSAAIEDWPVPGCCASPGTARTWRTTLQASCSDSVRLGVQRHRQSALPGGGNRVQRRQALSQRPMDTSKQPFLQSVTRTGTSVTRSRTLVEYVGRPLAMRYGSDWPVRASVYQPTPEPNIKKHGARGCWVLVER